MIACPGCGRQVSPRAASCPGCGEPIASAAVGTAVQTQERTSKELKGLLVCWHCVTLIGVVMAVAAAVVLSGWLGVAAALVMLAGIIGVVATRARIWWHHG